MIDPLELTDRVAHGLAAENAHWPNGHINHAARRVAVKRRARAAWPNWQEASEPVQTDLFGGAA